MTFEQRREWYYATPPHPCCGFVSKDISNILADWKADREKLQEQVRELKATLADCICQIEYLHEKFPKTGTSESVLSRAKYVLAHDQTQEDEG